MANIFVVFDCKTRKTLFATLSARKALNILEKGRRIDIWNDGFLIETIRSKERKSMQKYVFQEKEFIGKKQAKAEQRNARRKMKGLKRSNEHF